MNEENQKKEKDNGKAKEKIYQKPWIQSLIIIVIIFGALGGFLYWQSTKNAVFIENSYLDAPITDISPGTPGMLNALYVKEGDKIEVNSQVALVGSETLYSKDAGIVSSAPEALGGYYAPGQSVVSIVSVQKMRVLGSIDENKGLSEISPGQSAKFTVDAYPGKKYDGIVDEISPISNDTSAVFSISDKRPIKKFDIYIRFNTSDYPELKTGMSAKITVNTKK